MHTTESLTGLTLGALQTIYKDTLGKPTRCPNKGWLIKQILGAQAGEAGTTAGDEVAPADEAAPGETVPHAAPTAADEAGAISDGTEADAAPTEEAAAPTDAPTPAEEPAPADEPTEPPAPQDTADTATTAPIAPPAPAVDPNDPWAGATGIEDRIAVVRRAASVAQLTALAAAGKRSKSAVRAEMAKQQDALERVAEATERNVLAALASGKQAHTRPGVGEAIRAALAALGDEPATATPALASMTVDQLQAEYIRVVGRSTGSDHRGYLIWKIREALKGKVTVGAIERTAVDPDVEHKVLPIRMEETVVDTMDAAWKRLGYKNRMAFIRDALAGLLAAKGEAEAATAVRGAA